MRCKLQIMSGDGELTKMMHDPSGLCNAASSHLGPANTVWAISHHGNTLAATYRPPSPVKSDGVQHASCNNMGWLLSRSLWLPLALIYCPRDARLLHFPQPTQCLSIGAFSLLNYTNTVRCWIHKGAEWECQLCHVCSFVFVLQPHLLRN